MGREERLKMLGLKNATYQHADGSWRDYPPEGFNGLDGVKVEVKAFGYVTNPGDPGWVDPAAPPEVQAEQKALRDRLAQEWTEEAMEKERKLEEERTNGQPL